MTALSMDGGGTPRNGTLGKGTALVCFGAFSQAGFVTKAWLYPDRVLGLETKGHLGAAPMLTSWWWISRRTVRSG
ncbi:MAG: hypothetical protein MUQ10_16540 [Anaerolineae bacterium]|nr:hypothetical protein [Anaerolineae bacterium]